MAPGARFGGKGSGRGNLVAGGERNDAAKKTWPLWILLIGIATACVILGASEAVPSPSLERDRSAGFRHVVVLVLEQHGFYHSAGFDWKEHLRP
jgi:hypothetical protein